MYKDQNKVEYRKEIRTRLLKSYFQNYDIYDVLDEYDRLLMFEGVEEKELCNIINNNTILFHTFEKFKVIY